jgi:hypothetical protein
MAQLKCLGTTVRNEHFIQDEMKRRSNSGTAWYRSVQNFLTSLLLSKNLKIRMHKIIIFLRFCVSAKLDL